MNTSPLQKTISKVFPNNAVANIIEILFLAGVGMLAVVLHAKLRMPMQLPGKQGLLFIFLIVSAKGLSKFPFAASISAIGASTLLLIPGLGFHDPFIALNYLFLGCLIDFAAGFASRFTNSVILISLICGACWMFIPLFRLGTFAFLDVAQSSFRNGFAWPFFTHFIFGITGGILAGAALKVSSKFSR